MREYPYEPISKLGIPEFEDLKGARTPGPTMDLCLGSHELDHTTALLVALPPPTRSSCSGSALFFGSYVFKCLDGFSLGSSHPLRSSVTMILYCFQWQTLMMNPKKISFPTPHP